MGNVIQRIIARENIERPISLPVWMLAPPTPLRAGPSGLNAHLLPFRRRVNSSDKEEPERPVWPHRRPQMQFDDGDYEQPEDVWPEPPRRRKRARHSAIFFIDAQAGVEKDANGNEGTDDEIDDLDGFIVADNREN